MIQIKKDELGFLIKKGDIQKLLPPGNYLYPKYFGYSVEIHNIYNQIQSQFHPETIVSHKDIKDFLEIVNVTEKEICLQIENNTLVQVLSPGRFLFWKVKQDRVFIHADISEPEISSEFPEEILSHILVKPYITEFIINTYQYGLLSINGKYIRSLDPGRYRFWGTKNMITLYSTERRLQNFEIAGQELMTEDKITLRLNLNCQFKVVNPVRTLLEIENLKDQIHVFLQLVLRDFVSGWKLDGLLEKREEASRLILEKLKQRELEFGVVFQSAGIKDIILPGEMKDILNTVILAEKKAQANLIMRREETASTRSLLNTAKILDENPTLLKLKEWEHLEKILEKVDTLQLTSRGNILEQLENLFDKK